MAHGLGALLFQWTREMNLGSIPSTHKVAHSDRELQTQGSDVAPLASAGSTHTGLIGKHHTNKIKI